MTNPTTLPAALRVIEEMRREIDRLVSAQAGDAGEIMGLSVSLGFYQQRCEVLEAAAQRKLTKREQDSLAGCCPFCGVTVGEYVSEATKRNLAEIRRLDLALAKERAGNGAIVALQAQLDDVVEALGPERMAAADGYHGTAVRALLRERDEMSDTLNAVNDRLENWDWRGLLADARGGDFESMACAMHDVVRIYDAVKGPDPEMEKP